MKPALYAIALSLCLAVPAVAQQDLSKVEIKAQQLAPGVAVLFGAGGNIGVSYGEDGTVLVDDQFAPLTVKIQKAVSDLGATPVKFLINTHWHFDHSGGNENLGKAGAIIIAHDNVRVRMAVGATVAGNVTPPAAKAALPVITYADGLKLHLNGEEVRVIHMAAGHTDGDSIIHWTKSNIIHMGDLFMFGISFPFVDIGSGGDVRGFVAAADKALTIANDQTKIIPGHGSLATAEDLKAFHTMLVETTGIIRAGIQAGKTLDEIKVAGLPEKYKDWGSGFINASRWIEISYNSLKKK